MKPVVVHQFLLWARRSKPELERLNLYKVFRICYLGTSGREPSEEVIQKDLAEFAKGKTPWYVSQYLRRHVWADLVKTNLVPQPRIIT